MNDWLETLQGWLEKAGEQPIYSKMLPEVEVFPIKLRLGTKYPIINKQVPFTGHSSLTVKKLRKVEDEDYLLPYLTSIISKSGSDADYNLITNNCSDATREVLEELAGKKINPFLFTTPGDVRDFFKENFEVYPDKNRKGEDNWYTYINEMEADIVDKYKQKQREINRNEKLKNEALRRIKQNRATPSDYKYKSQGN